jgi:hypothetical protein
MHQSDCKEQRTCTKYCCTSYVRPPEVQCFPHSLVRDVTDYSIIETLMLPGNSSESTEAVSAQSVPSARQCCTKDHRSELSQTVYSAAQHSLLTALRLSGAVPTTSCPTFSFENERTSALQQRVLLSSQLTIDIAVSSIVSNDVSTVRAHPCGVRRPKRFERYGPQRKGPTSTIKRSSLDRHRRNQSRSLPPALSLRKVMGYNASIRSLLQFRAHHRWRRDVLHIRLRQL